MRLKESKLTLNHMQIFGLKVSCEHKRKGQAYAYGLQFMQGHCSDMKGSMQPNHGDSVTQKWVATE